MAQLEQILAQLRGGDDQLAEAAAAELPACGQPALDALSQLRQDADPDVRWWAIRALAQFPTSPGLTDELVAALGDDSPEVQQCAALALCHHPAPQAISLLIRLLSSPDSLISSLSATALTLIGPEAVPSLLEVVRNERGTARLEAVRALAEIKDPRAIPTLMKVIESDSAVSRYWAEQGLDKLGLGMVYLKPD
jgi:HEAT repeat protein